MITTITILTVVSLVLAYLFFRATEERNSLSQKLYNKQKEGDSDYVQICRLKEGEHLDKAKIKDLEMIIDKHAKSIDDKNEFIIESKKYTDSLEEELTVSHELSKGLEISLSISNKKLAEEISVSAGLRENYNNVIVENNKLRESLNKSIPTFTPSEIMCGVDGVALGNRADVGSTLDGDVESTYTTSINKEEE